MNDQLIRALRVFGGKCGAPNRYDDAADALLEADKRIAALEARVQTQETVIGINVREYLKLEEHLDELEARCRELEAALRRISEGGAPGIARDALTPLETPDDAVEICPTCMGRNFLYQAGTDTMVPCHDCTKNLDSKP